MTEEVEEERPLRHNRSKEVEKMESEVDFVRWFSELSNKDVSIAGGKGASLSEMYNAKVPVPPGFVVTAQAYQYFIEKTGIGEEMKDVLGKLDVNDTAALNTASKKVREVIEKQEMPQEMKDEIVESYDMLDVKEEDKNDGDALGVLKKNESPFVAVRSSATTEDLADASFAGQQETFLNVRGKEQLLEKVKKCMSSLFTPRAIFYREKKGFEHHKSYLAVVVQKMIDSDKSGVMFSQNPTKDDKTIVIEAVFGLGEGIVSGKIKPDHYVVDPNLEQFKIVGEEVARKKIAIVKSKEGKTETITLDDEKQVERVLDNFQIKRLAQHARQLEEHYKKPQDIEFAIDSRGIYIVQSRPITTKFKASNREVEGKILLSGLGASPGVASGPVRIIHDLDELEKIEEGDVLVTEMTNPDMVVSMQKSAAIITDEGGVTSHAAIVSREMGIPAVVGTGDATGKLKDGDVVTVDGSNGKIIEGKGETKLVKIEPVVPTKIKIKVIVDIPGAAERAAKSGVKSIGLTRLEGIIASGGKHPFKFVQDKDMTGYVDLIYEGIKQISNYFEEMWIRTSDLRSDEYGGLEGAPRDDEPNPMLGDHGIRFSLKHKDIMKSELQAIKKVAEEFPDKKFGIMAPQIISLSEVQEIKKIAGEVNIPKNIRIGIMVETPAAVQIINSICEEGISFISFGTNDLTQYTLAVDRNNEDVQNLFDETHPAIVSSIKYVIRRCQKSNVETSICGQAGSRPEMAKILFEAGIDSISVNADAARKISLIIAELEGADISKFKTEEVKVEDEIGEENEEILPGGKAEIFSDGDIEEVALKALDSEDIPSTVPDPSGEQESDIGSVEEDVPDIPALNDAIPIESETLEEEPEEELVLDEEIGEEWGDKNE